MLYEKTEKKHTINLITSLLYNPEISKLKFFYKPNIELIFSQENKYFFISPHDVERV